MEGGSVERIQGIVRKVWSIQGMPRWEGQENTGMVRLPGEYRERLECQECTEEWDKSQELTVHDEEVYKERMKTVRRKPDMPWIKKEHN